MNIQEYISGGIVESYVLGLASREEQLEFEQRCVDYPEVQAAREAFEVSLERHAIANAITPPVELKQKVWAEVQPGTTTQVVNMIPETDHLTPVPVRKMNLAAYVAAAAIILLLVSTALNFYFYRQYQSSVAKLDELVKGQEQLANNNTIMQTKLQQYENSLALIRDPKMAVIAMKGQPVNPSGLTTVYWDTQTKDVYLLVNNLPQPTPDKQYQLWAIVDGKPVDAGVFDMKNATAGLITMKNIPRAQAFAITLEKKGGSVSPTMPIYVMGQS